MSYYIDYSSKTGSWAQAKELARRGKIDKIIVNHYGNTYAIDLSSRTNPELDATAKIAMAQAFFGAI